MEFTYRPIVTWPGKLTANRQRSNFKSTYSQTLALLDRELRFLGAKNIVLQVALSESDIRLDGRPRADARRPTHPGVILSFESRYGWLNYPCDKFLSWEDNLRAIALSLEALRTVDRYGVTRRGEQYTGWAALPKPRTMEPIEARQILEKFAGISLNGSNRDEVFRAAAMATHPDRGGNEEDFKLVQQAKEALA